MLARELICACLQVKAHTICALVIFDAILYSSVFAKSFYLGNSLFAYFFGLHCFAYLLFVAHDNHQLVTDWVGQTSSVRK